MLTPVFLCAYSDANGALKSFVVRFPQSGILLSRSESIEEYESWNFT